MCEKLNEMQLKVIKVIGDLQFKMSSYGYGYIGEDVFVGFHWNGVYIVQPFFNESGTHDVDPIKYYKEDFLNSDFIKKVEIFKENIDVKRKNNQLSEQQLKVINIIGEIQYNTFCNTGEIVGMVNFIYDDIPIINPFLDYSGFHDVDPIKSYGEKFLNSKFVELVKDL